MFLYLNLHFVDKFTDTLMEKIHYVIHFGIFFHVNANTIK